MITRQKCWLRRVHHQNISFLYPGVSSWNYCISVFAPNQHDQRILKTPDIPYPSADSAVPRLYGQFIQDRISISVVRFAAEDKNVSLLKQNIATWDYRFITPFNQHDKNVSQIQFF